MHKCGGEVCRLGGRVFFFSSRRRHTRLQGDWSSDVCSSDLPAPTMFIARPVNAPIDANDRFIATTSRKFAGENWFMHPQPPPVRGPSQMRTIDRKSVV